MGQQLSPTIVQHRIRLNEDTTPKRDPQRRLNPIMQEVVHTEIVKLLDNGIIYPISEPMGQSYPRGSKEIWFHRSEKREQRVGPNSTSHKNSSLH